MDKTGRTALKIIFTVGLVVSCILIFHQTALALTFTAADVSGSAGDRVTVEITVNDGEGLLAADLFLEFDPYILRLTDVQTGSLTSGFSIAHSVTYKQLAIAIARSTPLDNGNGTMIRLAFTIDDAAPPGTVVLSMNRATTYDTDYQNHVADALPIALVTIVDPDEGDPTDRTPPSPSPAESSDGGGCFINSTR